MQKYTLQIGDYFCSNADRSSWYVIPGALAPAGNDNCIGIVFKAGKDDGDNSDYANALTTEGPTLGNAPFHGYVVALTDVNAGGSDLLRWEYGPNNKYNQSVGTSTKSDDWKGYYNCMKIREFVDKNSGNGWDMKHFPAAYACMTYGNRTLDPDGNGSEAYAWQWPFVAPDNTSGWFLPSCGQLECLYDNTSLLSSQIGKVKSNTPNAGLKSYIQWFSTSYLYWSSTEANGSRAWELTFRYGRSYYYNKDKEYGARAILAF